MGRVVVLVVILAAAAAGAVAAVAGNSPKALRAAIFAKARQQHAVHYVELGAARGLSQTMVGDVAATRGVQRVKFAIGGRRGRFTVLVVKRIAYLRADRFTLHVYFGFTAAQAARDHGRWISVRPGNSRYKDLASSVTLPSFLHDIYPGAPLALVRSKIGGRTVTGVRGTNREPGVRFVEALFPDAKLRPLGVSDVEPSKGFLDAIRISRWNEPVHVKAPANAVPIASVQAS